MKDTTNLCFSKDGVINPKALDYITSRGIESVVLFSDGSQEAFDRLSQFDTASLGPLVTRIGIGFTPLYEMRVAHPNGSVSDPNYVYSEDVRIRWICSMICSHFIKVNLSDVTSRVVTQAELDPKATEVVCYLAYRLWTVLKQAEDRLHFPAMVLDTLTRFTYYLTKETIDVPTLRRKSGLDTLSYNHVTDVLSVVVGNEEFIVKLSILNDLYGELILPIFNLIYGRRMRIVTSVMGFDGQFSEPSDMTYGQLGRVVEEMEMFSRCREVSAESPLDASDLLSFVKKVSLNDESCVWVSSSQDFQQTLHRYKDQLVRVSSKHDYGHDSQSVDGQLGELLPTHS